MYNKFGEFVGYLMPKAQGKELQKCVFIPQLLKKLHPDWKKKDTVQLCITILEKLKFLHDRNIILGDINPNNILVVSPTEVYFVDTDSYQIEGYPCPVGTINFTAPEIQKKRFDTFLRTPGNERFAVATLLFMIMLPGKPPYSLQGGEDQVQNILNGDFAYASGTRKNGLAPEGVWRFCWSHLPRYLKDDFYDTFHKDGKRYAEDQRYSDAVWLDKFGYYLTLLKTGKMIDQDEMSGELFPTRLKKNINATYIKCRECGEDVEEDRTEEGYCQTCLNKRLPCRCESCGKEIVYTYRQKYIQKIKPYRLCKACFDKQSRSDPRRYREDLGRQGQAPTYKPPTHPKPQPKAPEPQKSKGFCFITTATCEFFQRPDDCYELTTLRHYRDNWLAQTEEGKALIAEYYAIAPSIVKSIDASPQREPIYNRIWEQYIHPCIQLIELGAYTACRDLYMRMVYDLKALCGVED